jgi:tetratricopeptide (TPR) repeat protein
MTMKKLASFALAALMTAPTLFAQFSSVPNETMGSHMKSPEEKAMLEYAHGLKDKKKADEEQDHDKKMKLYTRAKDEFSKSVGYTGHYDGYLALGQVYLILGMKESALDACSHALGLKPHSEQAQQCVQDAQKKPESSEARPAGGQ